MHQRHPTLLLRYSYMDHPWASYCYTDMISQQNIFTALVLFLDSELRTPFGDGETLLLNISEPRARSTDMSYKILPQKEKTQKKRDKKIIKETGVNPVCRSRDFLSQATYIYIHSDTITDESRISFPNKLTSSFSAANMDRDPTGISVLSCRRSRQSRRESRAKGTADRDDVAFLFSCGISKQQCKGIHLATRNNHSSCARRT